MWRIVPGNLRPPLRLYGNATTEELGRVLARKLALKMPDDVAPTTWALLAELAWPLSEALDEGWKLMDDRARGIARTAAEPASMAELVNAFQDLGWGRWELRNVTIATLHPALKDAFADKLTRFVADMMRRWESEGYFKRLPHTG